MTDPTPGPLPSGAEGLAEEREKVVQRLSAHFASDHLDVAELERRLDMVYGAGTRADLARLVADLPALPAEAGAPAPAPLPIERWRAVQLTQTMVAIMSGADRKGQWTPPRHLNCLALMGGATVDFREARFGEPVVEVTVAAFMGGVEILVPPGVRVESNGFAIMGGFAHFTQDAGPDAPVIKVNGLACMGAVEIKVRLPGETGSEARKRLRKEGQRRLEGG